MLRFLPPLLAILLLALPAAAQQRVRFATDWALQGSSAPWLLADRLGFFREEGITLDLTSSGGSGELFQRLATGTGDRDGAILIAKRLARHLAPIAHHLGPGLAFRQAALSAQKVHGIRDRQAEAVQSGVDDQARGHERLVLQQVIPIDRIGR